ncbi:formate/nitrite transporter family protein [Natrinema sp. 1APR25-10V2]|uniref:formate/nitrite transporter family protein n=1 Tax=Natrinema sp. 1APR25-10V2 TaxID=2951081 RepID=UPI0028768F23|nr:formate/nitrite transporter family protein [Natrinema sp. 1APR25-10V2]MDS0477440.1 formate/nitrite transporter family protein [Natrinema sp. 1APR25-10V2]
MSGAPVPEEIFNRAVEEGERRLEQSLLELVSTSFIAGFTIVFGIAALGVVDALVEPRFGAVAHIAGALAFGVGVVFLVVGRTELFNENFFDPAAKVVDRDGSWLLWPLVRLWTVTLVFNLVGGFLFALVFAVDGVLPAGSAHALGRSAEEIVHRPMTAVFASAIVGGALVSLLSFLLEGVNTVGSRITLAYIVGFLLALGPFDHVIVTAIHVFFGMLFDPVIGYRTLLETIAVATAGNFVGGLGLVTFTHVAQVRGARNSDDGGES